MEHLVVLAIPEEHSEEAYIRDSLELVADLRTIGSIVLVEVGP